MELKPETTILKRRIGHILNSLSGLVKLSLQKLLHFWKLFLSMEFGKTSFKHVFYLQPKVTQLDNNHPELKVPI